MLRNRFKDSALQTREAAPVCEFKALEKDAPPGTFEGYASVFGVVDSYRERVMPGAFIQSLVDHKNKGTRVKMFWYHDPRSPIGKWLDLAEDKKGLYVKGQLNLNLTQGKECYELVKDNIVDGLSIGYRERAADDKDGVRELTELELLEVSLVTMPANPRATVDDIKSVKTAARFDAFVKALVQGKPMPAKDFEDLLREAGVPKSMATQIASVGYAKAIRSESESAVEAMADVRAALAGFARR